MKYYFRVDLFSGGWVNLLFFTAMIAVWLIGLFCLYKRNYQTAIGMVEVICLIAPLRTCQNLIFAIFSTTGATSYENEMIYYFWRFGISLSIPFIDAIILSLVILIPIVWAKKPIQCHCLPGIMAGIGATMILYYRLMQMLTIHYPTH